MYRFLCCSVGFFKLRIIQFCVEAFLGDQRIMRPLLYNISVFHDKDQICIRIVDNLCAMTKLVLPFIRLSIAFWIQHFCPGVNRARRSSRIRIFGSASIALAIVSSCFCPCDTLLPPHSAPSYPPGRVCTNRCTCAALSPH